MLSSVRLVSCLLSVGRFFITRDDQEEDSVGHCHKLEHQQWMCYLMHSFRQMRNQNINSQFTFTTSPFPPSPRRHCHWWIANCAISGVAILTPFTNILQRLIFRIRHHEVKHRPSNEVSDAGTRQWSSYLHRAIMCNA